MTKDADSSDTDPLHDIKPLKRRVLLLKETTEEDEVMIVLDDECPGPSKEKTSPKHIKDDVPIVPRQISIQKVNPTPSKYTPLKTLKAWEKKGNFTSRHFLNQLGMVKEVCQLPLHLLKIAVIWILFLS